MQCNVDCDCYSMNVFNVKFCFIYIKTQLRRYKSVVYRVNINRTPFQPTYSWAVFNAAVLITRQFWGGLSLEPLLFVSRCRSWPFWVFTSTYTCLVKHLTDVTLAKGNPINKYVVHANNLELSAIRYCSCLNVQFGRWCNYSYHRASM